MTVMFWTILLVAIPLAAFLASAFIRKLGERWNALPDFVWNVIGGNLGVVGINDYRNGLTYVGGRTFLMVRETLTISDFPANSRVFFAGKYPDDMRAPSTKLLGRYYHFPASKDAKDLFVPFASEQYLSFKEQEELFIPITDPAEFITRKRRENEATDARKRWGYRIHRYDDGLRTIWGWSLFILCISLFVAMFTALHVMGHSTDIEPVTVYTTSPNGGLVELHTTQKDQYKMIVMNRDHYNTIHVGKVVEMMGIGGNITQVCIPFGHSIEGQQCGRADSSLHVKKGDVVYLRPIQLLNWKDAPSAYFDTTENVVITKAEADQLLATGQFRVD